MWVSVRFGFVRETIGVYCESTEEPTGKEKWRHNEERNEGEGREELAGEKH